MFRHRKLVTAQQGHDDGEDLLMRAAEDVDTMLVFNLRLHLMGDYWLHYTGTQLVSAM